MNVTAIKESEWNKDGTIVKVTTVSLDDGREAPGYDLPLVPEVGKPLPDGWEVATAKSGKLYIKVPKAGGPKYSGGVAAFRNTKEGQAIEQDAMNRRTALMQAVAVCQDNWDIEADKMYAWLSGTGAGSGEKPAVITSTDATESTPRPRKNSPQRKDAEGENSGHGMAADRGQEGVKDPGEDRTSSCLHPEDSITLLKPDGKPLPQGFWRCTACGKVAKDG
jgi:hypothetical protein